MTEAERANQAALTQIAAAMIEDPFGSAEIVWRNGRVQDLELRRKRRYSDGATNNT